MTSNNVIWHNECNELPKEYFNKQNQTMENLNDYLKGKVIKSIEATESGCKIEFEAEKFMPKDGDFCRINRCLFIYKNRIGIGNHVIEHHFALDEVGNVYTSNLGFHESDEIVLLGSEDKDRLIKEMAKDGKKWNAAKLRVEKLRWRADVSKTFFTVVQASSESRAIEAVRASKNSDETPFNKGNYFQTKDQAQAVADRINAIFAGQL